MVDGWPGFGGGLEGIEEGGSHLRYVRQEYPRRRRACLKSGFCLPAAEAGSYPDSQVGCKVRPHSEPNPFRMMKIQIYMKTKHLKSFVFIYFRENREGLFYNQVLVVQRYVIQVRRMGSEISRRIDSGKRSKIVNKVGLIIVAARQC